MKAKRLGLAICATALLPVSGWGQYAFRIDTAVGAQPGIDVTAVAFGSDATIYYAAKGRIVRHSRQAAVTIAGNGNVTDCSLSAGVVAALQSNVCGVSGLAVGPGGDVFFSVGANVRVIRNGQVLPAGADVNVPLAGSGALAHDGIGALYIERNYRIFRIDVVTGVAAVVAGDGSSTVSGDEGLAVAAGIGDIRAMAFGPTGLHLAGELTVRRIDQSGRIRKVAGGPSGPFSLGDFGPATEATIVPTGLAFDSTGQLHIAERDRIRVVDGTGTIRPFVMSGGSEFRTLAFPAAGGLLAWSVDRLGAIMTHHRAVRVETAAPYIEAELGVTLLTPATLLGGLIRYGFDGKLYVGKDSTIYRVDLAAGTVDVALHYPEVRYINGLAHAPNGDLYFADGARILKATSSGIVTTVAGQQGAPGFSGDGGPATNARIAGPRALTLQGTAALVFVDEANSRVRRVDLSSGNISTLLTLPEPRSTGYITTLAADGAGDLFIAASGKLYRYTATAGLQLLRQGVSAVAAIPNGGGLVFAEGFTVWRSDSNGSNAVRIAGTPTAQSSSGDGGPARVAGIVGILDLDASPQGQIFIAESLKVRVLTPVCSVSLPAASPLFDSPGGSGSLNVPSSPGACAWVAGASEPWLRVTSAPAGNGPATLTYTVDSAPNHAGVRTAIVAVNDAEVLVSQVGLCSISLPHSAVQVSSAGGQVVVWSQGSSADCKRQARTSASWITVPEWIITGDLGFTFDVDPLPSGAPSRSAVVQIGNRSLSVLQVAAVPGVTCEGMAGVALSPATGAVPPAGARAAAVLTAPGTCKWNAFSNQSWLQVFPLEGAGSASISYWVEPNYRGTAHRGPSPLPEGHSRSPSNPHRAHCSSGSSASCITACSAVCRAMRRSTGISRR